MRLGRSYQFKLCLLDLIWNLIVRNRWLRVIFVLDHHFNGRGRSRLVVNLTVYIPSHFSHVEIVQTSSHFFCLPYRVFVKLILLWVILVLKISQSHLKLIIILLILIFIWSHTLMILIIIGWVSFFIFWTSLFSPNLFVITVTILILILFWYILTIELSSLQICQSFSLLIAYLIIFL